jgi:RNA polymerase sigma-70 factor, ECF subfamily
MPPGGKTCSEFDWTCRRARIGHNAGMTVVGEATRPQPLAAASDTAERLFQEHAGWIYGYCLRILRSPEEAEDALQTTYLNACRSLNEGTRPRAGSAWLLRIAQNVCFERLRASGRRGRLERVQDIAILEDTVAAPAHAGDDLIGLTDALLAMPEQQRTAILLREWQGLSYSEVAEELGVTQSAVETLIFRGRRALAAGLESPPRRRRLRSLHAFDLGGLLAGLKGLLAGTGIKAVAALTVAAATTATVVANDPIGALRERPASPPPAKAVAAPASGSSFRPAVASSAVNTIVAAPDRTRPAPGPAAKPGKQEKEKGRSTEAPGRSNVPPGQAKKPGEPKQQGNNGKAVGKANAPGQKKKAEAAPVPPEELAPPEPTPKEHGKPAEDKPAKTH